MSPPARGSGYIGRAPLPRRRSRVCRNYRRGESCYHHYYPPRGARFRQKKEKKKARAAATEGAVVVEEEHRSEALAPELAPYSVESERPVADNNNDNRILLVGGFDKVESDDEEVELCRCIHCLELEDSL